MRVLALWLLVTGGCRFGFDARSAPGDGNGTTSDSDSADAAPVPTCTGHDEDGDGFPDACDVCPTVPDPAQLDRGEIVAGNVADGVGDACDPRPTLAGDYIQLFDAHTNSATTTYSLNGTTSWQPDALRLGAANGTAGQADFILSALPSRFETRMHVIAASTTMLQWFGVWYCADSAATTMVFAQAADTPGDGFNIEMNLKEDDNGTPRFSTYQYGPPVFAAGDTYTIVVETALATGGDDTMYITAPPGITSVTSLAIQIPCGVYGFLEANKTTIDFDYFIAYAIR